MKNTLIVSIILLLLLGVNGYSRVENPSVFVGEVVNGGTNGAPMVVSSTGKVSNGLATKVETSFTSNITTTSATDVLITGMTTTPALAGTYLVIFSAWFTHSNGNATVTFSIYSNAVQSAGTIRTMMPFTGSVGGANNGMAGSTNGLVTIAASQVIQVEWHTSTGTVTAHDGTMDVIGPL